jgi:hypothetical protein
MAVVISLAPRRRAHASQAPAQRPEPATILFFTGVRYERQGEPIADAAAGRTSHAPSTVRAKRSRKATRTRQPA